MARIAPLAIKFERMGRGRTTHQLAWINGELGTLTLVDGLTRSRTRPRSLAYLTDIAPGRARIFSPHMPDPQSAVKADLLQIVGLSGDPDALAFVQPLQQDPDPVVARAAARAVARLSAVGLP